MTTQNEEKYKSQNVVSYLPKILGLLRAASFLHQTHHWQCRGPAFQADHLLFGTLYADGEVMIDDLAEKMVMLGGKDLVDPLFQSLEVNCRIKDFVPVKDTEYSVLDLANASLKIERDIQREISEMLASQDEPLMSVGLRNMLEDIADKREGFIYHLQQRCDTA